VLTLGLTSGALAVLHGLAPSPNRVVELLVLVTAGVCATVTRYMALRSWVFARAGLTTTERNNQWPPHPSHYPAL